MIPFASVPPMVGSPTSTLTDPFLIHHQNPQNPNPLSSFIPLPPLDSLPYYLRVATHRSPSSSSGIGTSFIRREYYRELGSYDPQGLSGDIRFRMRFACSSMNIDDDDCYVMILQGPRPRLAFCKLCCDNVWAELNTAHNYDYRDVMYSNKDQVFYALTMTSSNLIEAWDFSASPPLKPRVLRPTGHGDDFRTYCQYGDEERYLVESTEGDLLLVIRYYKARVIINASRCDHREERVQLDKPLTTFYAKYGEEKYPCDDDKYYETQRFKVYKLDMSLNRWVYMDRIGDQALFVGRNHSFSLPLKDFPELTPDSIYFTDSWHSLEIGKGHDSGVYNMKSMLVTPILASASPDKRIHPPPIWLGGPKQLIKCSIGLNDNKVASLVLSRI